MPPTLDEVRAGRRVRDRVLMSRRSAAETLAMHDRGLRFHDAAIGGWRSTWIGPMQRVVRTFVARRVVDDVVLETDLEAGRTMRWTFGDITADAFTWTNETEHAGEWVVTQRFTARRVSRPD